MPLFQDTPTSIKRSVPVPVVWVMLMLVPLAAAVLETAPSGVTAAAAVGVHTGHEHGQTDQHASTSSSAGLRPAFRGMTRVDTGCVLRDVAFMFPP